MIGTLDTMMSFAKPPVNFRCCESCVICWKSRKEAPCFICFHAGCFICCSSKCISYFFTINNLSIMIPRTSIDEANKHLQQLYRHVDDLEGTVHSQRESLLMKDRLLQQRVTEISSTKEQEIESLSEKLHASERTVSILQEELERKNQQINHLQHNLSKVKRVLNFKDDVKDLLKTIEDAEEHLSLDEGDTDGLLHFYQMDVNGATKKIKKKRYVRSAHQMTTLENGTQSDVDIPHNQNPGGKEFYL